MYSSTKTFIPTGIFEYGNQLYSDSTPHEVSVHKEGALEKFGVEFSQTYLV